MSRKTLQILIWSLVGIFCLTYAVNWWITFSPIEYSGEIFMWVDMINSLLRWPSILIALGLALWQKQRANAEGTQPSKAWVWIAVIIAIAIVGRFLFFFLIIMSAAYI